MHTFSCFLICWTHASTLRVQPQVALLAPIILAAACADKPAHAARTRRQVGLLAAFHQPFAEHALAKMCLTCAASVLNRSLDL